MPPSRPKLIASLVKAPYIGNYLRAAHDSWLRRKLHRYWELNNTNAKRLFEINKPTLTNIQERVLTDLNTFGIAIAHYHELFADRQFWDDLYKDVSQWLESAEVKEKERSYLEKDHLTPHGKKYIVMRYKGVTIPPDSALLEIGLRQELLNVANSYLGRFSRLYHADVWNTIPLTQRAQLTGSQRWHRDPEDIKLLKIFLYLTDVEITSGPLHYIRNSRGGEKYGHLWPQKLPLGSHPPAEELEAKLSPDDLQVCLYPAGTFVFVDTTGFHMGGRASESRRVLATWAYVSEVAPWQRVFNLEHLPASATNLTPAEKFALYQRL
jgi:hypothetical protein